MFHRTAFYIAIFASALVIAQPASCEPRLVTMTGHGEASGAPDQARIYAGVDTHASFAADAAAQNAAAMHRVMDALQKMGIPPKAIRTARFRLDPDYDQQTRKKTGYGVSNDIVVTLDDVSRAGAVLDVMIEAGANRSDEIDFSIKNQAPLLEAARAQAAHDAHARAQAYAEALGVSLGPVVSIKEDNGLRYNLPATVEDGDSGTVAKPGTQSMETDVTVVWSLK